MDKEMDRAVVDAGLRKKSTHHKNKEDAEKGYVLDPSPLQLTTAGTLIHAIYALQELNGQEGKNSWLGKLPCRSATNFSNSCACLKAFETFTGKKSCPTCRKEQYQTRVMHDGACLFKIKYAMKIQASWRRYIVRKWYKNLRKTVPPKDSKSRKQFFEEKAVLEALSCFVKRME